MATEQQVRLVKNEEAFRDINERIERRVERWEKRASTPQRLVCECSNSECREIILVTPAEHRLARSRDDRFLVAPGHGNPEIEDVAYHHTCYWLVQKRTD